MAIVTHRTSKNARYTDVLEYYSYKHEESQATGHYDPIRDENGFMQERDNYAVAYLNAHGEEADPEMWATACMRTNLLYRKNLEDGDRKSHEYIISHPAEDREKMSMEDLMAEGQAFARAHLNGYDCLIGVHRDTDNDHIHISINSVRVMQRAQEEDWMMRDKSGKILACEMEAGGKHQDSPALRRHMNEWLLDYTREHGLVAKDNNAKADVHRAERHGSKNDQMRTALMEAAGRSKDMKDLQRIMKEDYRMELKIRGNTFSVQHPDSQKAVRLRTLGLEPADLTRRMAGVEYTYNKQAKEQQKQKQQIRDLRKEASERRKAADRADLGTYEYREQMLEARRCRQDIDELEYILALEKAKDAKERSELAERRRWQMIRDYYRQSLILGSAKGRLDYLYKERSRIESDMPLFAITKQQKADKARAEEWLEKMDEQIADAQMAVQLEREELARLKQEIKDYRQVMRQARKDAREMSRGRQ